MATVYAVASAKGGVGKTTTTAAIATVLAGSGADVVAIDADIGMANLAGALGVTPDEPTLHDVLAGRADPLDAVHEGPEGLRVVPGSEDLDAYASADPAGLADVVAAFEDADYVLVDAGAGLSHDSSLPLAIADETLLVSTAERSALGDTEKTRQLAERLGGDVAGAAITRVDPDADEVGVDGLAADVLDAAILGRIPEDDAVVRAATANRPLPTFAPDAPATRAYRDLTRALTDVDIEGAGTSEGDDAEADDTEPDADDDADDAEPDEAETAAAGATSGSDENPVGEGTEAGTTSEAETVERVDTDEEDIIVADAEAGGLSDPGDEEDIIVADEDPAAEGDGEAETTGETETVGEEHVDGDDLEAMIEDDVDDPEAFDEAEAPDDAETIDDAESEGVQIDDAESPPKTAADEPEPDDGAAAAEEPTADPDDELAGSVPFRDDDTGMNTVLSEGAEDAEETEEAEEAEEPEDAAETDDEEGGEEKSGGFFSRLFGR
ncbi:P-loop NTPase [Halorubrum sp. CBA1229]|uniref:nucleotide-binding protein n=1 Tax=Halorubrum sp. CBA1229 TaxID=1853699 RepID=UPI000F410DF5|nr:P-loop NTPase [Halorubrum sp. CBA1229]QKY16361.1 P-loop NTPase [Halorubrum sp. CBA1229]